MNDRYYKINIKKIDQSIIVYERYKVNLIRQNNKVLLQGIGKRLLFFPVFEIYLNTETIFLKQVYEYTLRCNRVYRVSIPYLNCLRS